jgi:hypothetical protein
MMFRRSEDESTADSLDLYVLDALANDFEDLEGVLRMLNSDTSLGWKWAWGRDFEREEVVSALSRLVSKDAVRVLVLSDDGKHLTDWPRGALPPASYGDVYFAMTERGRVIHSTWDPVLPTEDVQEPDP